MKIAKGRGRAAGAKQVQAQLAQQQVQPRDKNSVACTITVVQERRVQLELIGFMDRPFLEVTYASVTCLHKLATDVKPEYTKTGTIALVMTSARAQMFLTKREHLLLNVHSLPTAHERTTHLGEAGEKREKTYQQYIGLEHLQLLRLPALMHGLSTPATKLAKTRLLFKTRSRVPDLALQ